MLGMRRGRPPKNQNFNFRLPRHEVQHESQQPSTSATLEVIRVEEEQPSNHTRAAKIRCLENIQKYSEILSESQYEEKLEYMTQRAVQRRSTETDEQCEQRLEEQRRRDVRHRRAMEQNNLPSYKLAVNADVMYQSLGPFTIACIHCRAVHFPEERVSNRINRDSFGDCCLHGRIALEPPQFPNELARLFLNRHSQADEFHLRIRSLNSCFALASFNVEHNRTMSNRGIYSFTAAGQIYHRMNMAAHPTQLSDGAFERPQYGQLYFLDSNEAVEERVQHPVNHGISRDLIALLDEICRSQNPFAQAFMMMREVEEQVNQQAAAIGMEAPRVDLQFTVPEGVDRRRFNVPVANEVCAVFVLSADQSIPHNEMVVHQRGKNVITLKNIDNRVEPFTYPLFYPKGTLGYDTNLQLRTPYASRAHMTRLELAQYRLSFRPELARCILTGTAATVLDLRQVPFNALHFGGRLLQQYLVDTYIRVERDRIQWIKYNQTKILAAKYEGVTRFINELAERHNAVVGEKIILPSSFPGSTRYFMEHFEDAMAIVRRLGSPDFFVTITCNPDWPEIKDAARIAGEDGVTIQQLSQNRPDLVARVAKLKFDDLIDQLDKKQIFGKVAAYVYTIEFQKRGLPHMHLLLIMSAEDKMHSPEELDDLVSAEIPDGTDPELRKLVLMWMIHNPCGEDLNPNATCMVDKNRRKKCRFDFPKPFLEKTSLADDKKPNYRRRYNPMLDPHHPEFSNQHAIYRKDCNGRTTTRDNRHVAPYNAHLLKRYNCHINVEYVGSIRAVKYLYKYIYKGHDCASIRLVENNRRLNYNEADTYVEGRCITPPEACWRLLGNEIQKKSHAVQRLNIHLRGQHRTNLDNAQEDMTEIGQKGSTLEAYFLHNRSLREKEVINHLNGIQEEETYHYYWQMPENFKWVGRTSEWLPRTRRLRVIGRIHNVTLTAQPELYYLRSLLYHVKNATSFEDLLTFEGVHYTTYKQACLARGLTYDDQQWIESLQESAASKMPSVLRTLFAQILILGSPENPKRLWEMFKENLAEDFIREAARNGGSVEEAIARAYRIIAHKLNSEATEGRNFRYWVQTFGMNDVVDCESEEIDVNADESVALGESMYRLLRGRQTEIVDTILTALDGADNGRRCFFIDGPGGTGKTFIYKTLYHILRGRNRNVKCMAFTGIAAILLPDGRTTHRTFGLKVPLTSESTSNIKPRSVKANLLAEVDIFLMDEGPMLPKYGLHNMDQLLRAIGHPNLPFGGKILVLGGDFRQCLPILPRGNRTELIDLSIKKSHLWEIFQSFTLDRNMRVDPEETEFATYLLKLGNGELPTNALGEIKIPEDMISNGDLIDEVFGHCLAHRDYEGMKDRAILAPLNKDVSKINGNIIAKLPGEFKIYHSFDSVKDQTEDTLQFTPDFLNSIDIPDLPPHELRLKKNTIIMLLRNLDVTEGLCNGTRLIVTDLCNNIIKAKIVTGERSGQEVHIPRITLDSSKGDLGCTMQRHQFPVRPAFTMTIHKAQGQTFEFVGVDLRVPVFMHGMLYVAFSRVKRRSSLKVLLPHENPRHTLNVVWKEMLR